MASGPWFYFEQVTLKGLGDNPPRGVFAASTNLQLTPPFPNPPDPPISRDTWVSASITEIDGNGLPFQGDASIWVANIVPQDDRSIRVQVLTAWEFDLRGMIRLLFWTGV
jgi:hypothetical protein